MTPYWSNGGVEMYHGDCRAVLASLPEQSVQTCITSPPYWGLRDYGMDGQLGLEPTPDEYIANMVEVFREVRRVLRDDGTLWLNLGDSYAGDKSGLKPKDLVGIPWRVALALQADGWWLRSDIIWAKPNPMPESVTDRPTKSHEYIFLLSKSQSYYYDADAIREPAQDWGVRDRTNIRNGTTDPKLKHHGLKDGNNAEGGRNKRSVWTVATQPFPGAHFATFPEKLIEPCILAGSAFKTCWECGNPWERQEPTCDHDRGTVGGTVLDPFVGSGTTGKVARKHGRRAILIDANSEYLDMTATRLSQTVMALETTL